MMQQDDQYDEKRLVWMKEDLRPEHHAMGNQMIPYDMGPRHPLDITDLSNNMLEGKLANDIVDMHMTEIAGKKKRGRPKKVRGEGEEVVKKPTVKRPKPVPQDFNGEMPQKKRGRPKKGAGGEGSEVSQRPPKTPQPYNGDMPKKKRGRPKKTKGDKDDGMPQSNEMSQGGGNDSRAPNEYMASMYSPSATVNTCSSLPQHLPLRLYDQPPPPPPNKFNVNSNYFGISGSPNAPLNNSTGNYSQNYHSQHQYTHSDLSSEISAAISTAEHLGGTDDVNSPASASPNLGPPTFDQPPGGMLSGSSTPPNRMPHQMQQPNSNICYSPYRNTPPSNEYMHLQQQQQPQPPQSHSRQSAHTDTLNEGYLPPQPPPQLSTQATNEMHVHQMGEYSQVSSQHQQQQLPHQHPYHQQQQHQQGPPPPMQRQQPGGPIADMYAGKMLNTSDVTSKSLSGLESLVDQIPSLSSYNTETGNASTAIDEHSLSEMRNVMDNRINDTSDQHQQQQQPQQAQQQQQESQSQFENNCIYTTDYSPSGSGGQLGMITNSPELGGNTNRSRSNEGNGSATPNSNMSITHQPPNANFSPSPMNMQTNTANASPSAQTPPANNTAYSSLCSPFSVSSLTATGTHSYSPTASPTSAAVPMNSYHSMAAAIQSSLPPPSALYMESPHIPMAVNPLYHHPHHAYPQHHHPSYPPGGVNYSSMAHHLQYQQQQHQLQQQSLSGSSLPTLHMPSPNYPYGYGGNSSAMGYHQHSAAAAVASNPAHAAYLAGHHSMFDRIKPDIGGYGG